MDLNNRKKNTGLARPLPKTASEWIIQQTSYTFNPSLHNPGLLYSPVSTFICIIPFVAKSKWSDYLAFNCAFRSLSIWLGLHWYWEDRDALFLLRLSVLTGEQANNSDYNWNIINFHSIYDYFALLESFDTNTLNTHQYVKDKLSSHQPSQTHNTRYR